MLYRSLLGVFLCCLASNGFAFGTKTHRKLTETAARLAMARPNMEVPCLISSGPEPFFTYLFHEMTQVASRDAEQIRRRWPDADLFNLHEAKRFFDLAPTNSRIAGFDYIPCDDEATAISILVRESSRPDEDGRNQERITVKGGISVPEDPIVLDMGGVRGLASQAHAHYVLAEEPYGWLNRGEKATRLKSGYLDLLKDPRTFALAHAVEDGPFTLGTDMAMQHFLLSVLAASWPHPEARRLSLVFLGHALHYVQDAADPLHTVQIGHICVLVPATMTFLKQTLLTGGGVFANIQHPLSAMTNAVSNLHLWTEALWDEQEVWLVQSGWPLFWGLISLRLSGPLKAGLGASWLSAESARQWAPLVFESGCDAITGDALRPGAVLKDGEINAMALVDDAAAAQKLTLLGKTASSIALAQSIALIKAYEELSSLVSEAKWRKRVAEILATRIRAVEAREKRLSTWLKEHPHGLVEARDTITMPLVLAFEVLLLLLLALALYSGLKRTRKSGLRLPTSLPK